MRSCEQRADQPGVFAPTAKIVHCGELIVLMLCSTPPHSTHSGLFQPKFAFFLTLGSRWVQ
jgi:hypothetical protein